MCTYRYYMHILVCKIHLHFNFYIYNTFNSISEYLCSFL